MGCDGRFKRSWIGARPNVGKVEGRWTDDVDAARCVAASGRDPRPLMQILRLGTHNRKCNLNAIFSIFRVNAPETRPKTSQTTSTERRCLVVTRDRTVDRVNASRSRYVTVHRPAFERASPSNPPGNFHIDCPIRA